MREHQEGSLAHARGEVFRATSQQETNRPDGGDRARPGES